MKIILIKYSSYNVKLHANMELYLNAGLCGAATSNGQKNIKI
jgi:hypothetical protein